MNPDEMYVRERWERVAVSDAIPSLEIKEAIKILAGEWKFFVDYSAARAFTEQREEEIRQLEREIEWLEEGIDFDWFVDEVRQPADWSGKGIIDVARSTCTVARILAREQAALAELTRGMVGDGK